MGRMYGGNGSGTTTSSFKSIKRKNREDIAENVSGKGITTSSSGTLNILRYFSIRSPSLTESGISVKKTEITCGFERL